jgi:hypothetical protein
LTGFNHTFSAAVTPITATLPVTYTWQATGQEPLMFTGGITSSLSFAWEITGTKHITVSAQGVGLQVIDSRAIFIDEVRARSYLPMVLK